ncbi:MAG: hypothetical protein JO112_09125 [Planctomycetes bacterium]|nr:hypothetical protein [Planctomycetota bacterium]
MNSPYPPFQVLRQFLRPRSRVEHCELCSAELAPEHQHLMEPATRQLLCSCDACALLFSGPQHTRYRRVPRRIVFLQDFCLTDSQWESLHLPINLAFFFQSSPAGKVIALYPSPAGATESLLPLDAWQELARDNPVLQELEPDVEALLVNRVGQARESFRAPIDECYKLVGLIRTHWRGLAGGVDAWKKIGQFLTELKERSVIRGEHTHA